MNQKAFFALLKQKEIRFVDLRFTDTRGKEQHVTVPVSQVNEELLKVGKPFDGSSIAGWKSIDASDMLLRPDTDTAIVDPFFEDTTLNLRCDVYDPSTGRAYHRDPRFICKNAEKCLVKEGIADTALIGSEPEFFVFDSVSWKNSLQDTFYSIRSVEGAWSSELKMSGENPGHRPRVKGGYFPVPPVDSMQNLRSLMCSTLEKMGVTVEVHHHEVGTAGQSEIGTRFAPMVKRADIDQILKYVVLNVAHNAGHTATFMPKPMPGENGNGMHVHLSLQKSGINIFSGEENCGLSKTALYFIGGIFAHAKAINAFTNASTNSYKRLVPGFEAPVLLAYSSCNRSASIRIPFSPEKSRRIEVRFPDASGNPYLTFASIVMAGIDGVRNQIDPKKALDKDLYALSEDELRVVPTVCCSLDEALKALDEDREFLRLHNTFENDVIDSYLHLKREEVSALYRVVHPIEFEMSYSC